MTTDEDPLNALYWRDEMLQIMYWLQGEGLGEQVTPDDLLVFLAADRDHVQIVLEQLVEDGYVMRPAEAPDHYCLTEQGLKEGGRRFAAAFDGWNRSAHGVCSNPNCSCHTLGPEACESQTAHQH